MNYHIKQNPAYKLSFKKIKFPIDSQQIPCYPKILVLLSNYEIIMFLSTSHNKIDKKGRVSVPRNFRTYLDLEGGSLILFKSLQFKCIEGTTLKRIIQYVEAIDEIDAMSKDASILRMMIADSFEIKYDNEGRINIPESLLSHAYIDDVAVFAGIGKSFMIWSDIEYEKEYQNTQKILQSSGPPKLILNKKLGVSNE